MDDLSAHAQSPNSQLPIIKDSNFLIEEYVSDLDFPTNFDFIGNDILILEKDGNIRLVKDGMLVQEPIKKIDVSTTLEEGLLGILTKDEFVYLHYTTRDPDSDLTSNWFYKFTWDGDTLTEPHLIKEIHGGSYIHNSGVMEIFNDQIVMTIGDLSNRDGITQNNLDGDFDHTSVIIPIEPVGEPIAIGIRNSFGLDVDPKTGYLWNTENGDDEFDEINLVFQDFNSGWSIAQGPATETQKKLLEQNSSFVYADPKFSWERPIGVTAIHVVTSSNFDSLNDYVLVGAFHNGNLYNFKLNSERNGFIFENEELYDYVLNKNDDATEIIFGTGFQAIVDIKEGPDGYIYILSIGDGKIFRIMPNPITGQMLDTDCRENILQNKLTKNCDLSNMDLSNMDLSNMDLSFSNFENSNLSKTSFSNSILVNSNFINSKISETDFSNSNLESAVLFKNLLRNVDFSNANMKSVNFKNSTIFDSNFTNANLEFALFSDSIIKNSHFSNSYLYYSDFTNSNISGLDFSYGDLSFAKFNNVDASYSNFSNSRLWKTQLDQSFLIHTNFINSDNYYSTYVNSNLQNSDFLGSRFSNVNLSNSDLSGVNLMGIYPIDSNFENTNLNENTKINTCLNSDPISKIVNRIFRATTINDSSSLMSITNIFLSICN